MKRIFQKRIGKKILSLLVITALSIQMPYIGFSDTGQEDYFNDVSGHWAEASISKHYKMGHINGYENGEFQPDKSITVAESLAIINRVMALDRKELSGSNQQDSWYNNDLSQARYYGYLENVSTRLDEPASRMDILNMMDVLVDIDEEQVSGEREDFVDLSSRNQR